MGKHTVCNNSFYEFICEALLMQCLHAENKSQDLLNSVNCANSRWDCWQVNKWLCVCVCVFLRTKTDTRCVSNIILIFPLSWESLLYISYTFSSISQVIFFSLQTSSLTFLSYQTKKADCIIQKCKPIFTQWILLQSHKMA